MKGHVAFPRIARINGINGINGSTIIGRKNLPVSVSSKYCLKRKMKKEKKKEKGKRANGKRRGNPKF